jgi:multiple sugar transport system ATP-binding protein
MADVTLRHVYKVYDGGVRAVNDFDLEIKDKEFVVFVGPSGCGKSTTLRMIAGLEEITAGQLYIDGQLMNEVEPKNRDIAMVFQSYALYPHMTVYDNMAFGLKLRHTPREEIDRRVRAAAEILEISELLTRKPKALSGGQRQRVALGRTIVRDPKVFLLDEPLSNLDAKLRVSMRSEITKLHEKLETTFIYVTHDQTEAMTMGNRIVVMKDGFIQQADTPITLFEDPCNLFVATFLGSPQMNIIDAELFMDGKNLKAKLNGLDNMVVTFPDIKAKQLANKKYIGQKVLLGIRPEHVRPNEGDLKAFIEVVEHLGDESILYCKMENRKDPFIIKIPFNSKIHANEEINVAFNMDHIYMFDADTHKAIMGIPHEDEIPVRINNNLMQVGEQEVALEKTFTNHLLDSAFDNDIRLAIKPDYVSLTKPVKENEFEIGLANNVIKLGEQELIVDQNHLARLYDKVFEEKMVMTIKGHDISLAKVDDAYLLKAVTKEVTIKDGLMNASFILKGLEQPLLAKGITAQDIKEGEEVDIYVPMEAIDVHPEEKLALALKGKFEFVEQKTDYQAVYFSLKGVEGYFAIKVANGEKVELGKEVELYLPYQRIKLYDQDHNKINSREVVYSNDGIATVKTVNGMMKINVGGVTLTYPNNKNYADGQYEITFKQDKLMPIFSNKMLKNNDKLSNPEMEAPNKIKVSAYDEDVLGDKLLIYVQIPGCGLYASLVVPNNFSVYKMPKFEMYVPSDAFTLKAIK